MAPHKNLKITNLEFNNRFAQLPAAFFTRLAPTPFKNLFLVSFNQDAAKLIGLDNSEGAAQYFSGAKQMPGADYLASVYSGHQFGSYVPQLGDGRAIMIGEVNGYEIQLKGSGKTPYSRFGDGRAVLRSCIREYLGSEALHNLGVPTTRALCIVGSDEDVQRETVEKGAMLTRLAPSHIRFGHFEYFYYTGQHEHLRTLADFVISNYYPNASYEEFYEEVLTRTAKLMAKWQAVGWTHGVMNTDNMSILGLTIDYGPYGFMDAYNPGYIPNHTDQGGRYAYDQQPFIGMWNLYALGQALEPVLPLEKSAEIIKKYQPALVEEYSKLMRAKLGLVEAKEEDMFLTRDIMELLDKNKVDYTNFFRKLSYSADLRDMFLDREGYDSWRKKYEERERDEKLMLAANPKYILRNYMAETAIRKAEDKGDYSEIDALLELLRKPFDEQPENEKYAAEPPEWAQHIEISCSS